MQTYEREQQADISQDNNRKLNRHPSFDRDGGEQVKEVGGGGRKRLLTLAGEAENVGKYCMDAALSSCKLAT